jgi:hypothetical protein
MLGLGIQAAREDNIPDEEILSYVMRSRDDLAPNITAAMRDGQAASAVLDYLQQEYSPKGATEITSRQAGLGARAIAPAVAGATIGAAIGAPIAGVGAVPGAAAGMTAGALTSMVGDPLVALYNKMSGSNITAPSQAMDDVMTKFGLPQPITRVERISQQALRGMSGGFGGAASARAMIPLTQTGSTARAILDGLARDPTAQAIAGGAAGAAGQYVAEQGGGVLPQLGAALGVGMIAPGSSASVARTGGRVAGAVVSPFSQAGREAIAGNVLNKLAFDPAAARARLYDYEPSIPGWSDKSGRTYPGSRATTAGASRDPGLMGAETSLRGAFDTNGQFANRIADNNQARLDYLDRVARDEAAIAAAKSKRSDVTRPMREDAFANASPADLQTPIQARIDAIVASPAGTGVATENAMKWLRGRLEVAGNDPAKMYEVRKDVANAISGRLDADNNRLSAAAGQLRDVQRVIDDAIESAAPGYRDYMAQFAKNSRPINQMELLQFIRSKSLTGSKNPKTDDDVIGAANWTRQMRAQAEEIGATLSPQQQTVLRKISQDIDDGVAPQNAGRVPGSDTVKNMTIANLVGRMLGEKYATNTTVQSLARPLQWMYKLPEERVQALLVDAMLDPKLAADLMARANIVRVGGLSERLRQRAVDMGMSSAIGATEAEARRARGVQR